MFWVVARWLLGCARWFARVFWVVARVLLGGLLRCSGVVARRLLGGR